MYDHVFLVSCFNPNPNPFETNDTNDTKINTNTTPHPTQPTTHTVPTDPIEHSNFSRHCVSAPRKGRKADLQIHASR